MKKSIRWIIGFSMVIAFATVLYASTGSSALVNENHERDQKTSAEKKITACIGRFKIDFPEGMSYSLGSASICGWQIASDADESVEKFEIRLSEREHELMNSKNVRNLPTLESVKVIENKIARGKIFVFDRVWNYYSFGREKKELESGKKEALVYIGKASFRLTTGLGELEEVQQTVRLINQIRFRQPDEVPDQPGFCIAHGLILDPIPTAEPVESVVLFEGYADRPDLAIALNSMSGINEERKLIERHKSSRIRAQYPSHFKNIFLGKRTINGIPGEEVNERVSEMNGTHAHSYTWESDIVKSDVMRPFLALELSTGIGRPGEPVNSSLSAKEVQALWDQISGSIRPRPVKVEAAKPEATPPPGRAEAGMPCPVDGRWSCADHANGHDVVGGTTQKFVQGVKMPQAELLGPKPLFGRRKTFMLSTPTVWKLVKEPS
jgi:hypothetical protein